MFGLNTLDPRSGRQTRKVESTKLRNRLEITQGTDQVIGKALGQAKLANVKEGMHHGRHEMIVRVGCGSWSAALAIRSPDGLPHLEAAAGQDQWRQIGPMIAAYPT